MCKETEGFIYSNKLNPLVLAGSILLVFLDQNVPSYLTPPAENPFMTRTDTTKEPKTKKIKNRFGAKAVNNC
jgi:hypothetical protein